MRIQCAWCIPPRIMGNKEPLEDETIIEGICDTCLSKYFPTITHKLLKLNIVEPDRYADYTIEEVK